jgi:FtsP/CotA-like multicopper oxidase with cupredoxin domain
MKRVQHSSFKLNPIAASIVLAMASQLSVNVANAGAGWGAGTDMNNLPVPIQTYYANSPAGPVPSINTVGIPQINANGGAALVDSGTALRKFVDTLPGLGSANKNNLGQYIPVAVPEPWVDGNGVTTNDDYYEIAAVEYSEKMHSDLVKPTLLRGYVQIATANYKGKTYTLKDAQGQDYKDANGNPVFTVDNPHHLGPVIKATSGKAVRIKFSNFLPTGAAGNLFLPVDTTITGAGPSAVIDPITKLPVNYTQNRAGIHLVGGQNPWISAGSPHQWVAPAGEAAAYTAGLGKGASTQNVPDMPDPGAGAVTLYFPNNQSARFMFYQDRTSGLTRLNAYAGLEAGYVITDPVEQGLVISTANPNGVIPADQIPLIIEDKTFVPKNVAQQDAKWSTANWGTEGDLWFPHVYETNQDPTSIDGTNPVGRWDYGPWFWPIFPAPSGNLPTVSFTPEAFHDTPVINGTAYPSLTVDPKAYRFRILNASNDRFINLGLYQADMTVNAPQLDKSGNPIFDADGVQQFFTGTEVKMVPAVADVNGNPPGWDALNNVQLPAPQYPSLATTQNISSSGPTQAWPTDNRIGGAPDPLTAGPDIIAIGNDGGLLPTPVDIPAQPVTYEQNRRSITVGNIYGYGLLLAPSERSDAIIDFSKYAGQTLILYNDAPAPVPFVDSRVDYFTGDPDQTAFGGAHSTQPGYGPNTRTMMQIKVNTVVAGTTAAAAPFNADALKAALPAAYKASQPTPIVPEAVYNTAFGTTDGNTWAHVASGSFAQPNLDFSYTPQPGSMIDITGLNLITSGGAGTGSGMGYAAAPLVKFNFPASAINNAATGTPCNVPPVASATVDPKTAQVNSVTLTTQGAGCTAIPLVTFVNTNGGVGAQATLVTAASTTNPAPLSLSIPVLTKAEQELFDNYGRYNSTGGVELPFTTAITQTTVPLNYIDAATEIIGDGEIQLWKFVDNGLWTNALRFDFVDVQLVNRVGWDGTVKPPASNEVGWKDTLRLNPLEDVIVAMRAKRPATPFGLPQSKRAMDPSVAAGAIGSNMGFTVDPGIVSTLPSGGTTATTPLVPVGKKLLSTAVNVANVNYDNEYVWNSSILSHAENDLSRPVVFNPTVTLPDAPVTSSFANGTLKWLDPTPRDGNDVLGIATAKGAVISTLADNNPKNEFGFSIERASLAIATTGPFAGKYVLGAFAQIGSVPANVTSFNDLTWKANEFYSYKIIANNAAGSTTSKEWTVQPLPPTGLKATVPAATGIPVALSWRDNATNETGYLVEVSIDGGVTYQTLAIVPGFAPVPTGTGTVTYAAAATLGFINTYRVTTIVEDATGAIALSSTSATVVVDLQAPVAPATPVLTNKSKVNTNGTVTLNWGAVKGASGYLVSITSGGTAIAGSPFLLTATTYAPVLPLGSVYTIEVSAQASKYTGALTTNSAPSVAFVADLAAPAAPADPTGLTAALASATQVKLSWVDNASTETAYLVEVSTDGGATYSTLTTLARTGAQVTTIGGVVTYTAAAVAGNTYSYRVSAQTAKFGSPLTTTSSAYAYSVPASVSVIAPAAPTNVVATSVANVPATTAAGPITVSWTQTSATNVSGFTVQRRTVSAAGVAGAWSANVAGCSVAATVLTCNNTTGITKNTNYQFQVTATSVVGNTVSIPSATVTAK